jgi:hypothetical protein
LEATESLADSSRAGFASKVDSVQCPVGRPIVVTVSNVSFDHGSRELSASRTPKDDGGAVPVGQRLIGLKRIEDPQSNPKVAVRVWLPVTTDRESFELRRICGELDCP